MKNKPHKCMYLYVYIVFKMIKNMIQQKISVIYEFYKLIVENSSNFQR